MRDPATYRGNRRERAKEIVSDPAAVGLSRVTFRDAHYNVKRVFDSRPMRMWKAAKKA
jgi:hypothetical protein